jgi:2-hydroxychromene-2-carboxylate isomerase
MSEARQRSGAPIEFWFDFASGYAYFAALEIEALAERHSRTVAWRLFRLGAAFKVTGAQGLSRTPLKRDYARRDWQRLARLKGVLFCAMIRLPASFRPRFVTFTGPYRAGLALRSQARGSRLPGSWAWSPGCPPGS